MCTLSLKRNCFSQKLAAFVCFFHFLFFLPVRALSLTGQKNHKSLANDVCNDDSGSGHVGNNFGAAGCLTTLYMLSTTTCTYLSWNPPFSKTKKNEKIHCSETVNSRALWFSPKCVELFQIPSWAISVWCLITEKHKKLENTNSHFWKITSSQKRF